MCGLQNQTQVCNGKCLSVPDGEMIYVCFKRQLKKEGLWSH